MKKFFYALMVSVLTLTAMTGNLLAQVSTQRSNMYIWDEVSSTWWRASSDLDGNLYVHIASCPPIDVDFGDLNLWLKGVARSTGTDTVITRLDTALRELYGVSRSTGIDTTITRLDSLRLDLYSLARSTGFDSTLARLDSLLLQLYGVSRSTDIAKLNTDISSYLYGIARSTGTDMLLRELYGLSRSTGTDTIITRLDSLGLGLYGVARSTDIEKLGEDINLYLYGVARSTGIDTTIARMDTLLKEIYGLSRSTGTDSLIARMDSLLLDLYGVARSTGSDAIVTRLDSIFNQLKTSATVSDIRYSGKASSGTCGELLVSGMISITGSIDGYSFYSIGGDTLINMSWKAGTLRAVDGVPIAPTRLSIPVADATINCVLNYGTTLYYDLNGVNP